MNKRPELRFVFIVENFDECLSFYEEILELEQRDQWNRAVDDRGVVFALGAVYLELLIGTASASRDSSYIYIETAEVDRLWLKIKDQAEVLAPIRTQAWKHRNFMISDPAGNRLKFFEKV